MTVLSALGVRLDASIEPWSNIHVNLHAWITACKAPGSRSIRIVASLGLFQSDTDQFHLYHSVPVGAVS